MKFYFMINRKYNYKLVSNIVYISAIKKMATTGKSNVTSAK